MELNIVEQVASTLRRAAEHRRLVPYQQFHALFDPMDPLSSRYAALEKAVALLAGKSGVDYGALLSLANGLAGKEFYLRFRRNRFDDYLAVMGSQMHEHSLKKKRCLVEAERARVFDDAKQRQGSIERGAPRRPTTALHQQATRAQPESRHKP
ncbi:hypothetical protein [Paraburkholderia phytofirmans]|uniref:Uncharacterized protein n=1 Tax=Paraburkholderia phytofirmans TaxID=261302 RepID=A0ABW9BMU7_9BURK